MAPSGRAARLILPRYLLRPVASPEAASAEGEAAEWSVMRSRVPCPSTSRSSTLVTCHPRRRHAATVGCSCTVFGVRYGSKSRKTSCADSAGREEAARKGGCAAEADWGPRRTRRLGEDIGTRPGVGENTIGRVEALPKRHTFLCKPGEPVTGGAEEPRPLAVAAPGSSHSTSCIGLGAAHPVGASVSSPNRGLGRPGSRFEEAGALTSFVESVSVTSK